MLKLSFLGSRILGVTVAKDQMYALKLKGISVCFSMLKAALCGSYVNFGVFRLYGDEALDNALNTFVKLLLSIPQSDLLVSLFDNCILLQNTNIFNFIMRLKNDCVMNLLYFYSFRTTLNYRRHTMFCWNAWHKII